MKRVVFLPAALKALRQHRAEARRLVEKINGYAASPEAQANNLKRLQGSDDLRLRVGDYRIVFTETEDEIVVSRIGPRGTICD